MEKPENATQEIYEIMLACWNGSPTCRPVRKSGEKKVWKKLTKIFSLFQIWSVALRTWFKRVKTYKTLF